MDDSGKRFTLYERMDGHIGCENCLAKWLPEKPKCPCGSGQYCNVCKDVKFPPCKPHDDEREWRRDLLEFMKWNIRFNQMDKPYEGLDELRKRFT